MRLTCIKSATCASLVALVAAASSASAAWPYYGWAGWRSGYAPYYTWSGYSGSLPRYWGYYPSYYGYNPYYYSYYPYYNSYYPTSYPSYYTYTPSYAVPQAVVPTPAYTTPQATVSTPTSSTYQSLYPPSSAVRTPPSNEATVVVRTAPDARIWFNGVETTQAGANRTFGTPELQPGTSYSYDVTVRWMENGKEMQRTRKVAVSPGEKVEVDLTPANLLKND
jgi:uncharacterized protein (TIGR03000 family)